MYNDILSDIFLDLCLAQLSSETIIQQRMKAGAETHIYRYFSVMSYVFGFMTQ